MARRVGYVQDERYAAGAWMRKSGVSQFCTAYQVRTSSQIVGNKLPTLRDTPGLIYVFNTCSLNRLI
jgi:hypothetical protein